MEEKLMCVESWGRQVTSNLKCNLLGSAISQLGFEAWVVYTLLYIYILLYNIQYIAQVAKITL